MMIKSIPPRDGKTTDQPTSTKPDISTVSPQTSNQFSSLLHKKGQPKLTGLSKSKNKIDQSIDKIEAKLVKQAAQTKVVEHHPPINQQAGKSKVIEHHPSADKQASQTTVVKHPPPTDKPASQANVMEHRPPTDKPASQANVMEHHPPTDKPASQAKVMKHRPPTDKPASQANVMEHHPPMDKPASQANVMEHHPPTDKPASQAKVMEHHPPMDKPASQTKVMEHHPPTDKPASQTTAVKHHPPTDKPASQTTAVKHPPPTNKPASQTTAVKHPPPTNRQSDKSKLDEVNDHENLPPQLDAFDIAAMIAKSQTPLPSATPAPQAAPSQPSDLNKMVGEIADRILVSTPADNPTGVQEIRIHLKESVLSKTEVRIYRHGGSLQVEFMTTSQDSRMFIEQRQADIQKVLGQRLSGETVLVSVQDDHSTRGGQEQGRSRQQYINPNQDDDDI